MYCSIHCSKTPHSNLEFYIGILLAEVERWTESDFSEFIYRNVRFNDTLALLKKVIFIARLKKKF